MAKNTSETGAAPGNQRATYDEPLPSVKLEPRPFIEPEDAEVFLAERKTGMAENERPEPTFSGSPDRANANPVNHPEAAAFVGNMWFWVLAIAVVALIVWGAFAIF